jgi:acyl carrier protein
MAQEIAVESRLMDLFKDKLEVDIPSPETDLMATGLLDSLVFVELLFHIEQEFGITVAMEKLELDNVRSVVSIGAFIEQHFIPDQRDT